MARVQLDVTTNFAEASREMKRFGTVVKKESREYGELVKKYDNDTLDKLAEKHRRLASAVRATQGPQQAAIVHQRNLRKEIEKLIAQGLDPQDERLQKLKADYEKASEVVRKNTEEEKRAKDEKKRANQEATAARQKTIDEEKRVAQAAKDRAEAQKRAAETAKKTYLAVVASVAAVTAAIVKNTLEVGKNGDEYAKTGKILGITAEEYQELIFAADRSGVSQGQLTTALFKMNEELGKVKTGTGSLTTLLKDSNPELLRQLETAEGTSGAFNVMMEAIAGTNDEQERAALASAVWGRAGRRMINIALEGGEGIASLREEARQYGLISNESAALSEKFVDSQTNLKAAFTGIKNSLGVAVMPMLIRTTELMTNFIGGFSPEEISRFGDSVKIVFKGVLVSGGVLAKGVNDILSFMNTNIDNSVKNTFMVVSKLSRFIEEQARSWATVLGFFGAEGLEESLNASAASVAAFASEIEGAEEAARQQRDASISQWEQRNALILDYVSAIDEAYKAEASAGSAGAGGTPLFTPDSEGKDAGDPGGKGKTLVDRLRLIENLESQSQSVRISQFEDFFQRRIDQEMVEGEERFALLQSEYARIVDLENVTREEKLAAELALNAELDRLREDQLEKDRASAEARLSFVQQSVSGAASLVNSLVQIQKNAGRENRALLVMQKALATSEIAINTAVAVSKALASAEPPRNLIQAGIVGAAGVAQGVAVATTPIPSAETGIDRFVVPSNGVKRADGVGMRVNPGEEVTVTPRGETSAGTMNINVILDNEVVYSVVQSGIESGDIDITSDNVRQVAA